MPTKQNSGTFLGFVSNFPTTIGGSLLGVNLLFKGNYYYMHQFFIICLYDFHTFIILRMMYYSVSDTGILGKKSECSYQKLNLRPSD